jgi:hypothetical protein
MSCIISQDLDFVADLRFSDVSGNIAVAFFRVGELVVFGGVWTAGLETKFRHLGSICLRTGCVSVRLLRKPYECLYIYSWVVQQRTAGIY